MTPEEFRAQAHRLVDWMADYMGSVESYPVRAQVEPGEVSAGLAASAPEQGEATVSMPVEYRGEDLDIGFNPLFKRISGRSA